MKKIIRSIRNLFIYLFIIINLPIAIILYPIAGFFRFLLLILLPKYYNFLTSLLRRTSK